MNTSGVIKLEDVMSLLEQYLQQMGPSWKVVESGYYYTIMKMTENIVIGHAMNRRKGNMVQASRELGINRNTLRMRIAGRQPVALRGASKKHGD